MKDWAQELIEKIKDTACTDAEIEFCKAYENGDCVAAYKKYVAAAEKEVTFQGDHSLLIFPDGSCYADWRQDVDRFATRFAT